MKRVLVTDSEFDNFSSTKNLYSLPTYYNYGVGSAGCGVFRELAAHIKTTNWMLDGQIETFPLMYHYRAIRAELDQERHESYVEYWGGDENIGRYMLDRASANHELVVFLEYVPYVLPTWLEAQNLARIETTAGGTIGPTINGITLPISPGRPDDRRGPQRVQWRAD